MELVNTTPVPAAHAVIAVGDHAPRTAIFTAKATFRFTDRGEVQLDREDPFALLDEDQEYDPDGSGPLGSLPGDQLLHCDDVLEVMLVGRAHAPGGTPVPAMTVALSVGSERRELAVFGDRFWEGEGDGARISPPAPFLQMPLAWERAFGGRQDVLVDEGSVLEVTDPRNTLGRGFDHITEARRAAEVLRVPEGFPRFAPRRELPNLEDPRDRIGTWDDQPLPVCWAPVPLSSALVLERLRRRRQQRPDAPVTLGSPGFLQRAHPDWLVETPPENALVTLEGMTPGGRIDFYLPSIRVMADLRVGELETNVDLHPRTLVLLPEERRFYIVFRNYATFAYVAEETRQARLRLERGWSRTGGDD